MKGIKVNIHDVKVDDSFEMSKLVIKIIAISKGLNLSNTDLLALTIFCIEGYSKLTREKLIENKLFKSKNAVSNLVYSFRKQGILVKNTYGETIHSDFNILQPDLDIIKVELLIRK